MKVYSSTTVIRMVVRARFSACLCHCHLVCLFVLTAQAQAHSVCSCSGLFLRYVITQLISGLACILQRSQCKRQDVVLFLVAPVFSSS